MKILLADDDLDILEIMSEAFAVHGYDIHKATNGTEAITILNEEKIDFVVSDFNMPNGNGTNVLNFVNLMEPRPVFYFFSAEYESCLEHYLKLGVKKVFPKPFSFDKLLAEVNRESSLFPIAH